MTALNRASHHYPPRSNHHNPTSTFDENRVRITAKPGVDLFDTVARDAAKAVGADKNANKPAQLRKFYDELCLWEEKIAGDPAKFEEMLPFIRMMNAKVAYAKGRKLVDDTFVKIFQKTIMGVTDAQTLTICKLFWEAFMGFYKEVRPN